MQRSWYLVVIVRPSSRFPRSGREAQRVKHRDSTIYQKKSLSQILDSVDFSKPCVLLFLLAVDSHFRWKPMLFAQPTTPV